MKTTPALINFLLHIEGFREKAYDDQQPHLDLNPGDEHLVKGKITYGSGLTTRADGTPVRLGDTITWQENGDRMTRYVREEVEPVIENLIHVPLWDEAYDAIGSIIYNFGGGEVYDWRLWGRINRGEPGRDIAIEWITGTFYDDGNPVLGLRKRRIMEILMFFQLDWRIGENTGWQDDPVRVMEKLGWEEKPVTTADLNTAQLETLEDKARETGAVVVREAAPAVAARATSLAPKKKTVKVPDMAADAEPKLMEDSKTHRGLSKAESGKEAVIVGTTVTGVTAGLPVAKELAGFFKAYDMQVLLTAGLAFGGVLLLVGAWRWWAGKMIAYEGRQQSTQPKV